MTHNQKSVLFVVLSSIITILIMGIILLGATFLILYFLKEKGVSLLPVAFLLAIFFGTFFSQKINKVLAVKIGIDGKSNK
ncbi:MAG: hypothetical protein J6B32_04615 [Spirochaetaceae bacterium]|nr:hypothetical protein [Spirochaetaceae bacterium]MBO5236373.1 hypothetical protein [Spirochaetaceae bacterium]